MAKQEQLKVYVCPFCTVQQYFNDEYEIGTHLNGNHLRECLHYIIKDCLRQITKTEKRWNVSE